jgi:DNA-binding response OmpR family regulator/putative methionine-R-sulfoxide reductase with GAF domain
VVRLAVPSTSMSWPRPTSTVRLATGTVDLARHAFRRDDGPPTRLTTREAALLGYLAARPGEDVDRDRLRVEVWGHGPASLSRAVDATVARLRRKLGDDPAAPRLLLTVHGHGYRLVPDGDAAIPDDAPPPPSARPPLRLGDRVLDLATGELDDGERLSAKERLVLERLLKAEGGFVTPDRLAVTVGLRGRLGALSSLVYRLRSKIETDPKNPTILESRRDLGYRLAVVAPRPAPAAPAAHRDALASAARHLVLAGGVTDCVVYLREGDHLVQVAAAGPKRATDGSVRSPLRQALGEGLVGAAAAAGGAIRVPDVERDPRYRPDLFPARSELAVPIVADRRVVGVIDSEDPEVGHHTDRHEAVFVSLAAIAAAAFPRGLP